MHTGRFNKLLITNSVQRRTVDVHIIAEDLNTRIKTFAYITRFLLVTLIGTKLGHWFDILFLNLNMQP